MKKMLKVLGIIVVILVVAMFVTPFFTKNTTGMSKAGMFSYVADMANPFVKVEDVYGKLPEKPSESWKDAANGGTDYGYKVETVSGSGEERSVQLTSFGSELNVDDSVLKISIKGQYVRKYEVISKENVPKSVLEKLGGNNE
ncbi:YxeA family protein [Listeria monocytogenes]|nr:YxeA family protein [Listeria monocytogenes]EII2166248.1 YxeA family protein [Listeria monocytogenes]EII2287566.1 YxeA family protein [Listeria monocytogenes]